MIKLTKRKAFNFLRSYFDVLNEIPTDKDKLEFLMAVINKQFLDESPVNLSFISNLSYESQRHSIESSVKGFKTKMKVDLLGNPIIAGCQPPTEPPLKDPSIQEEEEGQEEEEVEYTKQTLNKSKEEIDFKVLLEYINEKTGKNYRTINNNVKNKFKARLKDGYKKEDILNAINNAIKDPFHIEENLRFLKPEYFSRANTLDMHGQEVKVKKEPYVPFTNLYDYEK